MKHHFMLLLLTSITTLNCMEEESRKIYEKKVRCMAKYWHPMISDILNGELELELFQTRTDSDKTPVRLYGLKHPKIEQNQYQFSFAICSDNPNCDRKCSHCICSQKNVDSFIRKLAALRVEAPSCVKFSSVTIASGRIPNLMLKTPTRLVVAPYTTEFLREFQKYEPYILAKLKLIDTDQII